MSPYAVERVYRATGDEAFREEALPVLTRFYRWLREARDPDNDGLIAVIQPEPRGGHRLLAQVRRNSGT